MVFLVSIKSIFNNFFYKYSWSHRFNEWMAIIYAGQISESYKKKSASLSIRIKLYHFRSNLLIEKSFTSLHIPRYFFLALSLHSLHTSKKKSKCSLFRIEFWFPIIILLCNVTDYSFEYIAIIVLLEELMYLVKL